MGFGDIAYTGMAAYGRFQAVTGAVIAVLIMLVMCYIGWHILSSDKKTVKGEVKSAKLISKEQLGDNNGVVYHMELVVNYSFGDTEYTETIHSSQRQYYKGDTISLQVDPKKPDHPEPSVVPHWAGAALLVGGFLVGSLGVGTAYFSLKSKEFAAVSGTASFMHQL